VVGAALAWTFAALLTEIAPVVGMPVTLGFNSVDYDLFIASYTPGLR
jgi:hypothetical protein